MHADRKAEYACIGYTHEEQKTEDEQESIDELGGCICFLFRQLDLVLRSELQAVRCDIGTTRHEYKLYSIN